MGLFILFYWTEKCKNDEATSTASIHFFRLHLLKICLSSSYYGNNMYALRV